MLVPIGRAQQFDLKYEIRINIKSNSLASPSAVFSRDYLGWGYSKLRKIYHSALSFLPFSLGNEKYNDSVFLQQITAFMAPSKKRQQS